PSAAVPARTRTSSTSSVAYATEDSASEEKTARADVFESRSCLACAVASGDPTNSFLTALIFTRGGLWRPYARGGAARVSSVRGPHWTAASRCGRCPSLARRLPALRRRRPDLPHTLFVCGAP